MDTAPGFRRIMACVAESPFLDALLSESGAMAAANGAELVLLHIGESATIERAVGERLRPAPAGYLGLRTVPADRSIPKLILEAADREGADLVFAGAVREEAVIQGMIGSVARRLARRADRSLFLSIHRLPADAILRSIAVSVGFDEASAEMLRDVLAFARGGRAEALHIVHEYEPLPAGAPEPAPAQGQPWDWYGSTIGAAERARLANFLEGFDLSGLAVRTACLAGRGGLEVVRYAEAVNASLLVAPAPPRRLGLLDRFFGHPTEFLLQRLPCSVLLHRRGGGAGGPSA